MAHVMEIVTPLGPDVLQFSSMRSRESLGRLFEYAVSVLSTRNDIDPKKLLGKNCTVKLRLPKGGPRCFDGLVTRFALAGSEGRFVRYDMTLRPWLWFLTRTADCRIFQNKSVPEIIKEISDKDVYPDAAFDFRLSGTYDPWEYCVQYRETDFNFISRLMEQEGIYYYFEHSEGKHVMVACDSPAVHEPYPNYANIPFVADRPSTTTEREHISDWYYGAEVQSGKYVIDDYDFKKPSVDLTQKAALIREHDHANHEIFDGTGEFDTRAEGDRYVHMRLEELQAQHERVQAITNARGISVGHTFSLELHPRSDQNREYLITSTDIHFGINAYESAGGAGATFDCSFECTPADEQFRTPRDTPKPIVQGLQTAKVVGPAGDEIFTDEYGRVKVHFHWDRYGKQNENDSCWIRVSQYWAGKHWGAIHIPRIGQEVVVEFIEGDPDRPLITGRVYNREQMPPWDLPRHKTQSGILSRSTLHGTQSDANLIRFEDEKGKEELHVHAQRNLVTVVEADEIRWVWQNRHITAWKDHVEHVNGNMQLMVGSGGGNQDVWISANKTETIGATKDLHVKGARKERIDGSTSLTVGKDQQEKVGTKHAVEAGTEIHLKAGMKVIIEAGMQLSLKGPGGFIDIGPAGVTIQGTLVMINSGGAAGSGSGSSPDEPADAKQANPAEPSPERP